MNYLRDWQYNPNVKPVGYWKNTSDNAIIRSFIDYAGSAITKKLEILLSGGYIVQQIDERMYSVEYEDDYDQILCYGISFYKKRCLIRKK